MDVQNFQSRFSYRHLSTNPFDFFCVFSSVLAAILVCCWQRSTVPQLPFPTELACKDETKTL